MPFGCLALRDGRTYSSMSDVTEKYEIGQVLRAKEFCELCLAKDRQTDKVFVCKKFLKKDGRKVRKAAKNEIMILKLVNHPNILQLIDTFETRKEYFIIQELATGGDVFDWILDQGNYTEKDASNVIRQVLEAVAYLHSLNIVHRNLKLENLMYYTENNHNKVVLRDFYLSRFENGPITEPCGTPEYLAPEVVARHRYGRPVDCWAVGVIMYILLSGNPPFYDETEEENTDLHNRIIFCRIVAGDFEFDSPYWDDISPAAKELVCRLMEVDQMLRITAQDALWHEWIAGNGASEKNLKDGVCAQFEKNFAKAKWRKAIRVTTFMQRLKNSEALTDSSAEGQAAEEAGDGEGGVSQGTSDEGDKVTSDGGVTSSSVSLEVTVENTPAAMDHGEGSSKPEDKQGQGKMSVGSSVGTSPSDIQEPRCQSNAVPQVTHEEAEKGGAKRAAGDGTRKMAANFGPHKVVPESKPTPTEAPESSKLTGCSLGNHQASASPDPSSKRKMAAKLRGPSSTASVGASASPEKRPGAQRQQKDETDASWCQTQVPEAVAERSVGALVAPGVGPGAADVGLGVRLRSDASPMSRRDREARTMDRYSAELSVARAGAAGPGCFTVGSSASLGRHAAPYNPEGGTVGMGTAGGYGSPYTSLYTGAAAVGMYGTGLPHTAGGGGATSDWQMDSVIEQIEKQMAAVLEKIEGDMPSLLEQISDCPSDSPRARSAHASPAASRARSSQHPPTATSATPPPLPTSPRPTLPSLPRLTIPPPSYPPPSPPTQASPQAAGEREDRDGQSVPACPSQSPRCGMGRGL
ncbi:caM kinase-like vesicle-associated, like [Betta splendens]|uniref:CaM kinase-like vesicle-associated protein n=1 Tax=Betta splendens TaxID=158456 RepID=A0A6P7MVL4_BETSP|nr:caM kinase-like vesicle-associated, like [Betta splendens]XP_055366549.1 caM kinase-like vesicle-associated, like [Betta splendens]